jgi:very-short-patch-repair endonuclease
MTSFTNSSANSDGNNSVILNKIEIWKKRLLDMSFSNPMLNFKFPKAASVTFHDDYLVLWQKLVTERRSLDFPFASIAAAEDGQPVSRRKRSSEKDRNAEAESAAAAAEPQSPDDSTQWAKNDDLWVECTCSDLQKLLKNISKKGRQFQEDKGVNVVYISAGFIKWREKPDSDDWYLSPLLMLPVELISRTVFSSYSMKLSGDGIVTNPTLQYKFSHDYGVSLPDYEEDQTIADYMNKISSALSKYTQSAFAWEVTGRAALGLFPFSNICIYRDLEANSQKIADSPLIRGICGDFSENSLLNSYARTVQKIQAGSMDDICLPRNTFQIVDADSSQQEAVLCANQGISFVLQGPPGTGKSQTITNIISDALAHNRKVLFVSEKKAALDVVYERLDECGLGDFCLVLHSDKTTSKEFSQQLFDVYEKLLSAETMHTTNAAFSILDELKDLRCLNNNYARLLHTPVTQLNWTVYGVLGELAELNDAPDVIFMLPQLGRLSQDGYSGLCSALEKYSRHLEKCGGRPEANPWYGNMVTTADGTRRQELNAQLPQMTEAFGKIAKLADELKNRAGFDPEFTADNFVQKLDYLSTVSRVAGVPGCWYDQAVFDQLDDDIDNAGRQQESFRKTLSELKSSYEEINPKSIALRMPIVLDNAQERHSVSDINRQLDAINEFLDRNPMMGRWSKLSDPSEIGRAFDLIERTKTDTLELRSELERSFDAGFFDLKAGQMCREFKESSGGFFKSFKSGYKDAIATIKKFYRGSDRVDDENVIGWLEQLLALQNAELELNQKASNFAEYFAEGWKGVHTDTAQLRVSYELFSLVMDHRKHLEYALDIIRISEGESSRLVEHFGNAYNGLDTDWNELNDTLQAFSEMRNASDCTGCDCSLMERIKSGEVDLKIVAGIVDSFKTHCESCTEAVDLAHRLFDGNYLKSLSPSDFADKLSRCTEHYEQLEDSIDFRVAQAECVELGLGPVLDVFRRSDVEPGKYISAFRKRVCNLWLDCVYSAAPQLASFRHDDQDRRMHRFSCLDQQQFAIAKDRVYAAVVNSFKDSLNSADSAKSAQFNEAASLLRAEHNKKRKHLPIRTMFVKMPQLIMQLKPCLMMSPLSVSNFLCTGDYNFDIVVFDEASQLRTESAIGSIFRGKQVIVAGDRHQMPPTNFFNATMDDPDDGTSDEYSDTNAYESLLDEAHALYDMTLRWHYRSKHESLIAFSNENIYSGKLVTFPSSTDEKPDVGVEYVFVEDAVYYANSNKPNPKEAEKVADIVFEHFDRYPKKSIGVIAFGMKQQACIEAAINARLRKNPEYGKFLSESGSKPFFVKSLENVQGDERDTIILDIGYGKNESGKMIMNFGPLSNDGGERRLNVAITRAKYNLKLVGSIQPEDIAAEKVSKAGPKLLRDFIKFAKNGGKTDKMLLSEGGGFKTKFEKSVCDFLVSRGYDVALQVGTSSLRIDLAVRHPEDKGQYVIGIECDGQHYGDARTARDRDRTRQSVLKLMGWELYQIWSVSWIRNLKEEQERLVNAIDAAIARYNESKEGKSRKGAPSDAGNLVKDSYVEKGAPESFSDVIIPENPAETPLKIVIPVYSESNDMQNASSVSGPVKTASGVCTEDDCVNNVPGKSSGRERTDSDFSSSLADFSDSGSGVESLQNKSGAGSSENVTDGSSMKKASSAEVRKESSVSSSAEAVPPAGAGYANQQSGRDSVVFPDYCETPVPAGMEKPSSSSGAEFKSFLKDVIEAESPVHIEYLAERFKKSGILADKPAAKVRIQLERAVMSLSKDVHLNGDSFLFAKGQKTIVPRQVGKRLCIDYIAADEIRTGVGRVRDSFPDISEQELLIKTARAFHLSDKDPKVLDLIRRNLK